MVAFTFSQLSFAQKKEVRDVSAFTKLSFGVPGKLYLKQGPVQKVELEGDAEALEKIETEVSGGKLRIHSKEKWWNWNWGNSDKIVAYVTVKNIEALSVSGSGSMIGENTISANTMDLNVSGSGNMNVEIQATGAMDVDVSGSGNIELKGKCQSLDSNVSGSGSIKLALTVAENAGLSLSGSGKVQASGSARKVRIAISGSGRVMGENFETTVCDVRISGSGDVSIAVKDELDATLSGSGSVHYRGNPGKINSHSSGSGKVRKI